MVVAIEYLILPPDSLDAVVSTAVNSPNTFTLGNFAFNSMGGYGFFSAFGLDVDSITLTDSAVALHFLAPG